MYACQVFFLKQALALANSIFFVSGCVCVRFLTYLSGPLQIPWSIFDCKFKSRAENFPTGGY